jgi:peptidoglycan hydrolase-like amidase
MKRRSSAVVLALLLVAAAHAQNTIRFGVLGLFHPHTLEVTWTGPGALVITGVGEPIVLNGEAGHRKLMVQAAHDRVFVAGRQVLGLSGHSRDGGDSVFELTVPGRFHRAYKGQLQITARGGELIPVVLMDRETAVEAIVASEMPSDAPLEALKAQAVATRSFLAVGPRHLGFDFCDTTHCQYMRSPMAATLRVREAVRSTEGLILKWRNRPVAALYSSRCGGRTRTPRQAGIDLDPGDGYPYYSVECRWCHTHPLRPGEQVYGVRNGIRPQWGWSALRSETDVQTPGPDAAQVRAGGHSIGMCQHGAIGMAQSGADFRSILMHYYPNTDLASLR